MTDGSTNNSGSLIMILIIIAICVVYFVMMKKQKKVFLEGQQELNKIKVGDKVRTRLGIYGVVTEFYETTDGKIARLNISQNDNECIVDVEFRYIMGVDEKN